MTDEDEAPLSAALDAFLEAYEESARRRREQEARAQMEPFIPWDRLQAKLKCKPEVWARIRRLNPDHRGVKAFRQLRGYHPNRRQWINMDVIGPKKFIELYGREAYRLVPKSAFRRDGHRKLLTAEFVQDFVLPNS
jgi:hypothetical protein